MTYFPIQLDPFQAGFVLVLSLLLLAMGTFALKEQFRSHQCKAFFLLCLNFFFVFFIVALGTFYPSIYTYSWVQYIHLANLLFSGHCVYLFGASIMMELKEKRGWIYLQWASGLLFYIQILFSYELGNLNNLQGGLILKPLPYIYISPFIAIWILQNFFTAQKLFKKMISWDLYPCDQRKLFLLFFIFNASLLLSAVAVNSFQPKVFYFAFSSSIVALSLIFYTIVIKRLWDIQSVAHRTLLWLLSYSLPITPVILTFNYFIKRETLINNWGWILSLALLWTILYIRYLQPYVDQVFYKRRHSSRKIIQKFLQNSAGINNIDELLSVFYNTSKQVFLSKNILVYMKSNQELLAVFSQGNSELIKAEALHSMTKHFASKSIWQIKEENIESPWSLALSFHEKKELIAVVFLGEKSNYRSYTFEDLELLAMLRDSLEIALKNTLLYQELATLNTSLEDKVQKRTQELKETQAELVRTKTLSGIGELAAGMAHNVNTYMSGADMGLHVLLEKHQADSSSKKLLETIKESIKSTKSLVVNLEDYSVINKNQNIEFSLKQCIENSISIFELLPESKQCQVKFEIEKDFQLKGSSSELKTVFLNLFKNAAQANASKIEISTQKNTDHFVVDITDNGDGIQEDIQDRIFEPFFTSKDIGQGFGLGLWTVLKSLTDLGAKIELESSRPGETRFKIYFAINSNESKKI